MTGSVYHCAPLLGRFLKIAVVAGVESAVRIHIERGDDLNARDNNGQTPLMLSAARNKAAICTLLLSSGADANLLDPTGRSALSIAKAAGALEAASAIEIACTTKACTAEEVVTNSNALDAPVCLAVKEAPAAFATAFEQASIDKDLDLDLSGWEAEADKPPPEGDTRLIEAAFKIQNAITEHQPIDTSAAWDSFETFLPELASPLPRADDSEARERLRLVLLRAIREGSVPRLAVEDLTINDDGLPNEDARATLERVINDLGAETDERFEYSAPHECFEVFVAREEAPGEEDAIAEALDFVNDLAERRNEPLRIYQREFQQVALLTAEAEVALGQAMERSLEEALDALALWPVGIDAVLGAARKVASGVKPLRWLSIGPSTELDDSESSPIATPEDEPDTANETANEDNIELDIDSKGSTNELSEFLKNAADLASLVGDAHNHGPQQSPCRRVLATLRLTRSFLIELARAREPLPEFAHAMNDYWRARDKMTVANLKLVHSIAKKYLFSGQPLDDLLQEGNIGLIKAVDRYDWRRGFKFSTYATWWIRQQVGRYVADKCKTIRLPVHLFESAQRIEHVSGAFERKHGYAPSTDEVAALAGLPLKKVTMLARASLEPLPIHEIDAVHDCIEANAQDQFTARDPMNEVEDLQVIGAVDQLLGMLKPKEQLVLRMRFGIGVQDSMTLEEVGVRLDVTRERIRQIESKALRRVKNFARTDQLIRGPKSDLHPTREMREQVENAAGNSVEGAEPDLALNRAKEALRKPVRKASAKPEQARGAKASALDKAISQARVAGIAVSDDRLGDSQTLWIHIKEDIDGSSRQIAGELIGLGFEFEPGKGYWL